MLETFVQSFRVKNAYRVNTFIYALKQIPLIEKALKDALYGNYALKLLGTMVSLVIEILTIFLGKFLYVLIMVFTLLNLFKSDHASTFVHILFFLTWIGALMNTYMFNPTKDKYYAMFTLRMDAKKYTLSNYYYMMLKVIVGFLPFTCIFGLLCNVPIWICLMIPFFIAAAKILLNVYFLNKYQKTGMITDENHPVKGIWVWVIICLFIAYGCPYFGFLLPLSVSGILMLLIIITGLFSISYLQKFSSYREIYKLILTNDNMNVASYNTSQLSKENVLKRIDVDTKITSQKHGYAYFNDLFVKRHSNLLLKSAKKISFVIIGIIFVMALILYLIPEFATKTNQILMVMLPYFVFIMYCINRGQEVAQAMFMNCDHSMLTYGFYREPKVILNLFKERLKSVIFINLLPAFVLATGLVFLLFITGGTTQWIDYPILFFSILAMSIFFSVHHLVLYYLLQPYNANSETKSGTYGIANGLTYLFCYYMLKIRIPIFTFGCLTILFSILYCLISLFLVYRYAPKTFHLKN